MSQLMSIRVKLGESEYPLNIYPEDEERIRKAAKIVQDRLEETKARMKNKTMEDWLAMVAFDSINLKLMQEQQGMQQEREILDKLNVIDRMLESKG
jgi:cell division protein ZapA